MTVSTAFLTCCLVGRQPAKQRKYMPSRGMVACVHVCSQLCGHEDMLLAAYM
jgi:hypothetical protein